MLVFGANDLASRDMQSDADQYQIQSHVVEFVSVPRLGHGGWGMNGLPTLFFPPRFRHRQNAYTGTPAAAIPNPIALFDGYS